MYSQVFLIYFVLACLYTSFSLYRESPPFCCQCTDSESMSSIAVLVWKYKISSKRIIQVQDWVAGLVSTADTSIVYPELETDSALSLFPQVQCTWCISLPYWSQCLLRWSGSFLCFGETHFYAFLVSLHLPTIIGPYPFLHPSSSGFHILWGVGVVYRALHFCPFTLVPCTQGQSQRSTQTALGQGLPLTPRMEPLPDMHV